jgi:hypothetical protein
MTQRTWMRKRRNIAKRIRDHYVWILSYANTLTKAGYAIGCRGHPGKLVNVTVSGGDPWGSDCEIRSLFDDVTESCSLSHCAPEPITKEAADHLVRYRETYGEQNFSLWFHESGYDKWVEQWHSLKEGEYGSDKTLAEYMNMSDEEYGKFVKRDWPENDTQPPKALSIRVRNRRKHLIFDERA